MGMIFSVAFHNAIIKPENFGVVTNDPNATAEQVAEVIHDLLGSYGGEDIRVTDLGDVDFSECSYCDHAGYSFSSTLTELLSYCEPGAMLEWYLDSENQELPQIDRLERDGRIVSYFGHVIPPELPPLDLKPVTVGDLDGTDDAADWLTEGHVLTAYEVAHLRSLRLPATTPTSPAPTYTLAEIRNGTGFPKGVRFIQLPKED